MLSFDNMVRSQSHFYIFMQTTILNFVEALREALNQNRSLRNEKLILSSKIRSLEENVRAYKLHVLRLKDGISAVCQQDVLDTKVFISPLLHA